MVDYEFSTLVMIMSNNGGENIGTKHGAWFLAMFNPI